jgi:hypothetical protein
MIGLTRFARYAGFAGWPSALPAFSKSAWLEIVPEFNPFKYNSFPVNAARQSYQLTQALSEDLAAAAENGANAKLPPVLAFQSVVDSTVIGSAVFTGLFARLPANGSEIVLFDVNRAAPLELLLSRTTLGLLEQTIPPGPRIYRVTVLGDSHGDSQISERSLPPGGARAEVRRLDLHYPGEFFSLSHIATPFPPSDSLYGSDPDDDNYGIHLGNQALRGERGTFINGADSLLRASCNPFFSYVAQRIDAGIASDSPAVLP